MSKKITLPSGASVTLKDPSLLRVKDRKRVLKSAETEGGDLSKALALGDALIAMLIEVRFCGLSINTQLSTSLVCFLRCIEIQSIKSIFFVSILF